MEINVAKINSPYLIAKDSHLNSPSPRICADSSKTSTLQTKPSSSSVVTLNMFKVI